MKKLYEEPYFNAEEFDEDVLTTSGNPNTNNDTDLSGGGGNENGQYGPTL